MTYLNIKLGAPDGWVKDFKQASPSLRVIMLAQLMELASDGSDKADVDMEFNDHAE